MKEVRANRDSEALANALDALSPAAAEIVIPAQDYEFLYANGASAIFGPGTVIPVAAGKIVGELGRRLGHLGKSGQ